MEYSVHAPSHFISTHQDKLLPGWSCPVASVLVVLQPCECCLLERTIAAARQKHFLRQQFLTFGYQVAAQLQQMGYQAEVFDPRTGLPLLSKPGLMLLDDVAVAQACLGYPIAHSHGCSIILHPVWGSAVYPSTLVSSAAPAVIAPLRWAKTGVWEHVFQHASDTIDHAPASSAIVGIR